MKSLLAWLVIFGFGGLIVLAVVFRMERARALLRFGRNAMWLYIAAVFGLAAIEVLRNGL